MPAFTRKSVLVEHWDKHGLQLGNRARCDRQPVANCISNVWRVINEVIRTVALTTMIKEFDAHVAIESDNPVADLMNLMEECPFFGIKRQADHRAHTIPNLAGCYHTCGTGKKRRNC
jgi:hypothetical protein